MVPYRAEPKDQGQVLSNPTHTSSPPEVLVPGFSPLHSPPLGRSSVLHRGHDSVLSWLLPQAPFLTEKPYMALV